MLNLFQHLIIKVRRYKSDAGKLLLCRDLKNQDDFEINNLYKYYEKFCAKILILNRFTIVK